MKDLWGVEISDDAGRQVGDLPVWLPAGFGKEQIAKNNGDSSGG
jgi:hypothetical protein